MNKTSSTSCSICLEPLKNNIEILKPCQHEFHSKCIDGWILRSLNQSGVATCPLCRTQIELTDNILKKRLIIKLNYNFIEKQYNISQNILKKFLKKTLKKRNNKFTYSQYTKQIIYEIASNYYNIILLAFTDINKISLEELKESIFFVGMRQESFNKTNLYKIYIDYKNNYIENDAGHRINKTTKQYIKNQLYYTMSHTYKIYGHASVNSNNSSRSNSSRRPTSSTRSNSSRRSNSTTRSNSSRRPTSSTRSNSSRR